MWPRTTAGSFRQVRPRLRIANRRSDRTHSTERKIKEWACHVAADYLQELQALEFGRHKRCREKYPAHNQGLRLLCGQCKRSLNAL